MKNNLIFFILLLSCNPYPTANRELLIEEPTIKTLDRDMKLIAIQNSEQNDIIQNQAAQITSLKTMISVFAKDTVLRSRQIVLLQRDLSVLTKDYKTLEGSYNLTFYWWKKDTLLKGIAVRSLVNDSIWQAKQIFNLATVNNLQKNDIDNLKRTGTSQSMIISSLLKDTAAKGRQIVLLQRQLSTFTKDQTALNTSYNLNFYWWKKDTLLKGIAVRKLIADSVWQAKQIANMSKENTALKLLFNKQVPSGQIATVQTLVNKHTISISKIEDTITKLVREFGSDFDFNIKKQLRISDVGISRVKAAILKDSLKIDLREEVLEVLETLQGKQ